MARLYISKFMPLVLVTLLLYITQSTAAEPGADIRDPVNNILAHPKPLLQDAARLIPRDATVKSNATFEAYKVTCGYPISGPYNKVQRLLFYGIAVFIFCFRFHKWLTIVGVGFLVTYTTTAAIHGLILSWAPNGYDLDIIAVSQCLRVGVAVGTNFLFHTPRMFKAHRQRTFVNWSLGLFLVNTCVHMRLPYFFANHYRSSAIEVFLRGGNSGNTCSASKHPTSIRSTQEETIPILKLYGWLQEIPSNASIYDSADAVRLAVSMASSSSSHRSTTLSYSPGDSYSPNLIITLILGNMVLQSTVLNLLKSPILARNDIFKLVTKQRKGTSLLDILRRGIKLIARFLFITLLPLQILYSIGRFFFGRFFGWLSLYDMLTRWLPPRPVRIDEPSKLRLRIAKALATLYFLWGTLAYLFWPAWFLFTVVEVELNFYRNGLPEQESPRNASQWGPCVGVGITILAAVFHRLRSPSSEVHNIWTLQEKERPWGRRMPDWLFGWEEGWYWLVLLQEKWEEFIVWWRDPMTVSWAEEIDIEEQMIAEADDTSEAMIWRKIRYPNKYKR